MTNAKKLVEITSKCSEITYVSDDSSIEIDGDKGKLDSLLKEGFKCELIRGVNVRIQSYQDDLILFVNLPDFISRVREDDFSKPILIINKGGPSYFYKDEDTYLDFNVTKNDFTFLNALWYFKFLDFLKMQEHKEDNVFYFVDHFNWDNRLIVFTSLKKEGKLTVTFPSHLPNIGSAISIKRRVDRFIKCFSEDNKHLPKFIKSELFNFLPKEGRESRIVILIQQLDQIIDVAEQNHELFLSNLSLETLKREYFEHKEKSFQQVREILGKVTSQIIGLPLSITVAAFSTYKVLDSPETLAIILSVFLVYSVYMMILLAFHKGDLTEVKAQSAEDLKKIEKSDFFIKYPGEITSFEKVKNRIGIKIDRLTIVVNGYFITLLISNIGFVLFVAYQLKASIVLISILGLSMILIGINLWFKSSKA